MIPGAGFISGGKGSIQSLGFGLLPVIILEVYKIILTQKLLNSHVSQVKRSAFLLFGQPVLNITHCYMPELAILVFAFTVRLS